MTPHHRTQQAIAITGLLVVTVIWGSTFILVRWTVASLDVYYFLFLRFLIATLTLGLVFHKKLRNTTRSTIGASFILSLFMFGVYAAQTEGLRFTTASNSALITGLYLVLIPLFSILLFRKKPQAFHAIGAAVSLAGLYLLTQYSIAGFTIGDGITLICSTCCAFHIILTGKFTNRHSLIPLVFFQFVFVTLLSGVVAAARGGYTSMLPPIAIPTLIVTGVFATTISFTVQTAAQRIIDPTRTGIVFAMEAVFGALFGYLIGGETFTILSFIGACLMVGGMITAEIKPVARYLIDKIAG